MKPGGTVARGYGYEHKQQRRKWAPKVARGEVACWRCGQPIIPGTAWDLGHDDWDRSITRGPEHAGRCNRKAAAIKRNRRAALIRALTRRTISDSW